MPAFGSVYSDTEIAAVANYVTARFGSKGSEIRTRPARKSTGTRWPLTSSKGSPTRLRRGAFSINAR
jgi:hypothetical protein